MHTSSARAGRSCESLTGRECIMYYVLRDYMRSLLRVSDGCDYGMYCTVTYLVQMFTLHFVQCDTFMITLYAFGISHMTLNCFADFHTILSFMEQLG